MQSNTSSLPISYNSVVQLQARGTHVARGSIQEKSSNLKFVEKQGIDRQIFNRKSISRKITHPQSLFK